MQITLPDDLQRKAARRAAETGYGNVSAYIEDLVRADAESEDWGAPDHLSIHDAQELEQLLLQRTDDSPDIELTPEFWEQLKLRLKTEGKPGEHL